MSGKFSEEIDIMQKTIEFLTIIFLVLLIGLVGWLAYLLVSEQVNANVKVGVLAAIGAVGATLMTHWLTKKREIEARHFNQKRECYESIMNTFGQLFTSEDARKKISNRQLTQAIIKHRKDIAVWADADLINWWLHMSDNKSTTLSTKEALNMGEKLIRSIRKELGKDDSKIESGHLIALFLKESPEEIARQLSS